MPSTDTRIESRTLGPDDPYVDFSREEAAYERERARLVREHLGQIALIHGDDFVGVFRDIGEAIEESYRRFGNDQTMLKEIRDPDPPDFISLVDTRHPSFQPD
jgi:hypothetical protein